MICCNLVERANPIPGILVSGQCDISPLELMCKLGGALQHTADEEHPHSVPWSHSHTSRGEHLEYFGLPYLSINKVTLPTHTMSARHMFTLLSGDRMALLLGHSLAGLSWDILTMLLGHRSTLLPCHLPGDLLTVRLGHVVAFLFSAGPTFLMRHLDQSEVSINNQ